MISILVIADAHIGRYPSKVPPGEREFAVSTVWNAAVDYAIDHPVDAVALTGDMMDNTNAYFEAIGPLRRGIQQLSDVGIPIFAVAGNHDYDVFPRVVRDVGSAHLVLLGPEGRWSTAPLTVHGRNVAWFTGWSFPSAHYSDSPLSTFQPPQKDEPIIGLVHGDLGARKSEHAPLALRELQDSGASIWLLGHIHKPDYIEAGGTPVLYPGSLQPLDPGEPGIHGPWLVQIDSTGKVSAKQVPLATVQYVTLDINLSEEKPVVLEDVRSIVTDHIIETTRDLQGANSNLQYVSYRLVLSGKTALHRKLATEGLSDLGIYQDDVGGVNASIDQLSINTTPVRDVETIAQFSDPPGTLAKWILELQSPEKGGAASELINQTIYDTKEKVLGQTRYSQLERMSLEHSDAKQLLLQQALLLLDTLMAQKDESQA